MVNFSNYDSISRIKLLDGIIYYNKYPLDEILYNIYPSDIVNIHRKYQEDCKTIDRVIRWALQNKQNDALRDLIEILSKIYNNCENTHR